jgi:hypothetical protein
LLPKNFICFFGWSILRTSFPVTFSNLINCLFLLSITDFENSLESFLFVSWGVYYCYLTMFFSKPNLKKPLIFIFTLLILEASDLRSST